MGKCPWGSYLLGNDAHCAVTCRVSTIPGIGVDHAEDKETTGIYQLQQNNHSVEAKKEKGRDFLCNCISLDSTCCAIKWYKRHTQKQQKSVLQFT